MQVLPALARTYVDHSVFCVLPVGVKWHEGTDNTWNRCILTRRCRAQMGCCMRGWVCTSDVPVCPAALPGHDSLQHYSKAAEGVHTKLSSRATVRTSVRWWQGWVNIEAARTISGSAGRRVERCAVAPGGLRGGQRLCLRATALRHELQELSLALVPRSQEPFSMRVICILLDGSTL